MKIVSIAISKKKGTQKSCIKTGTLIPDHGFDGDAHAGPGQRQVSFLSSESISKARENGVDVAFGDFAENIATIGIDWKSVPVGTRVKLGGSAIVEISQIGKVCHNKCAIYYKAGGCIMPTEGVFAKIIEGGEISLEDGVVIMEAS